MRISRNKKAYKKPKVVSEKVFEQVALACSGEQWISPPPYTHMKSRSSECGYSSS